MHKILEFSWVELNEKGFMQAVGGRNLMNINAHKTNLKEPGTLMHKGNQNNWNPE